MSLLLFSYSLENAITKAAPAKRERAWNWVGRKSFRFTLIMLIYRAEAYILGLWRKKHTNFVTC